MENVRERVRQFYSASPYRFWMIAGFVGLLSFVWFHPGSDEESGWTQALVPPLHKRRNELSKEVLAQALADPASLSHFPTELEFPLDPTVGNEPVRNIIEYAFDSRLQDSMETLFHAYKPDYGAFVALDARTGQVLSMVSYTHRKEKRGNLALRASFPSASVFKVVTAAAAIERKNISGDSVIPFNGANHTLYKSNVLKDKVTRWTRYTTLKAAFAKSINTVFGKIGAFYIGPSDLRTYAERFGFNRRIAADVPVEEGKASIPQDPWGRAESASGYTRENTMSPLQGALMAAAVVNDGVMMEPYLVESVSTKEGKEVYRAEPKMLTQAVDPRTAAEMRELMRETVMRGTSRGSFRGFFKKDLASVDVGGKTGSLTGTDPRGKYDWFVGYADNGARKIAYAALTINERYWTVKSSYLARKAIETLFKNSTVAANGKRAIR